MYTYSISAFLSLSSSRLYYENCKILKKGETTDAAKNHTTCDDN